MVHGSGGASEDVAHSNTFKRSIDRSRLEGTSVALLGAKLAACCMTMLCVRVAAVLDTRKSVAFFNLVRSKLLRVNKYRSEGGTNFENEATERSTCDRSDQRSDKLTSTRLRH